MSEETKNNNTGMSDGAKRAIGYGGTGGFAAAAVFAWNLYTGMDERQRNLEAAYLSNQTTLSALRSEVHDLREDIHKLHCFVEPRWCGRPTSNSDR